MQYKFLKVTSFYKNFLQSYEASNPDVLSLSYDEQHRHLMSQGYGYSNYFPFYLQKNHKIDGHELIHNARHMQNAWAREHGLDLSGNKLLLEQLKAYKPEILFIQDSANFSEAFIQKSGRRFLL